MDGLRQRDKEREKREIEIERERERDISNASTLSPYGWLKREKERRRYRR
jgi:hypothetical protein